MADEEKKKPTVGDVIHTLKGPVAKEIMKREGSRMKAQGIGKVGPKPAAIHELTGGQTIQPKTPGTEFQGEDSPETKKAFDEAMGGASEPHAEASEPAAEEASETPEEEKAEA